MRTFRYGGRSTRRTTVAATFTAVGLGLVAAVATAPSASADQLYCGPSENVQSVQVQDYADGHFRILLTPTAASRFALDPHAATVSEWHAVQNCVRGLSGPLADSIWDQLECHQRWALTPSKDGGWATGPTYDLETWHGVFSENQYVSTRCGNELGIQPDGPFGEPHDPSAGQTDLQQAWASIA